jgi:hypothetical protein
MHVRYERPMPDLTHTVTAPLLLDIGGRHGLEVERWSLDGLHPPAGVAGAEGEGWLTIPFHGFGITLRVHLRHDPATGLLRFEGLGQREARVLRHFYRELVTGRAVAMEGMIAAMDTPVEPVPMTQTPAEIDAQRREAPPRLLRIAAAVAIYAGLAVIAYAPILEPVAEAVRAHLAAEAAQAGP